MRDTRNVFSALAQQAGRGDTGARNQMERDLLPIVRRVIHNGTGTSRLERRILDEACRWDVGAPADRDELIRRIVRSLCSSVIAQLPPAASAEHVTAETIVSFGNPDLRRSA
jgi:hypothetical protein